MHTPFTEPASFFLVVCKDKNIAKDLCDALSAAFPKMRPLMADTPAEGLLLLAKSDHISFAFLAMTPADLDIGVFKRRLRQRGTRIVLIRAPGAHDAMTNDYAVVSWPFEPTSFLNLK